MGDGNSGPVDGSDGQWVNGVWVPGPSGAGPPEGEWVDGVFYPSQGADGQWVDGDWVPGSGGEAGSSPGPGGGAEGGAVRRCRLTSG